MAEEEDIISTLPDAILCHILSFLETNHADATSVLSKRWNHLWRSVHTLRFITQDDVPKDIREDDDIEDWVDSDVVPECLSLHLRTCNLFKLSGLQDELMLARYVLKNARVLQTMKIWNNGQLEIKRILFSAPKASSVCKLMVYND